MPSESVLKTKKQFVKELSEQLSNSCAGVVVDYKGITVAEDTKLRRELREASVEYAVVKNTMLRFAAKKAKLDGLDSVLEGTTALAVSKEDPVAAAKILCKFADASKGKFIIKAGFVDGEVLDAKKTAELGNLPSRDQLLCQLLSVLNGNIRGLAVALNAIAEKQGEAVAPEVE
ncbi:MAG: 50S ribosomal protein L10 [Acetanaerobacterium sp.]